MLSVESTSAALAALGEHLAARDRRFELVVIGGAALLSLRLIERVTRDVDVLARYDDGALIDPRPLPSSLLEARARVAADFALPDDWLNAAPASLLEFGLPAGFAGRLVRRDYGRCLTIWLASRFDQIHFKLYAMVDQGPGKHESDLRALGPSPAELAAAARWAITHDPSAGFRGELEGALRHLGASIDALDG